MTTLLNMLNPRSVRLDGMGGGKASITREDVHIACGMADKAGVELLMRKWASLRCPQTKDFYSIYRETAAVAVRENWRIREKPIEKLRSLVQLAIFEETAVMPCPACKGTQKELDMVKMIPVDCTECKGSGKYRIEPVDLYTSVGISKQAWFKGNWSDKYEDVKIIVQSRSHKALNTIRKEIEKMLDLS